MVSFTVVVTAAFFFLGYGLSSLQRLQETWMAAAVGNGRGGEVSEATTSSGLSKNEQTYDKNYWQWQESMNKFGAAYKGDILRHLMGDIEGRVLEFGCSGGYILDSLKEPAANRQLFGVEINPASRAFAKETFGKTIQDIYERPEDMPPDLKLDFIYTTSVLEHVDCPLCELRKLKSKLTQEGLLVVGLRNDGADLTQTGDKYGHEPNHHIYTWNPLLLSNMLDSAGFKPCHAIGQFDAWHSIDVNAYHANKHAYCVKGLETGKQQSVHNLWAVAVKADLPDADKACAVYKKRLEEILDCRYLKKVGPKRVSSLRAATSRRHGHS